MKVGTAPQYERSANGVQTTFTAIDGFDKYRAENFANWESRVPIHAASRDYNLAGLAADPEKLSPVVTYDLSLIHISEPTRPY